MSSSERSGMLDLERDLPTTAEDVAALRRAAAVRMVTDGEAYLRFLAQFPRPSPEDLRKKPGPAGDRPFDLIG